MLAVGVASTCVLLGSALLAQEPAVLRGHDERTAAEAAAVRIEIAQNRWFSFAMHLPSIDVQRRMSRRFFTRPDGLPRRVAHTPVALRLCFDDDRHRFEEHQVVDVGERTDEWPEPVRKRLAADRELLRPDFIRGLEGAVPVPPMPPPIAWHGTLLDGLDVYVAYWRVGCGDTRWSVIGFDAESGRLLATDMLSARWFPWRGANEPPLVQQVDLDGDGRMEINFPLFTHNGTVENTDWHYYLAQGKHELRPVLALATDAWLSVPSHGEEGFARALLLHDGPLSLRVLVYYDCPAFPGPLVPIGELWLGRKDRLEPFTVSRVEPWLTGAEHYLSPLGNPEMWR